MDDFASNPPKSSEPLFLFDGDSDVEIIGAGRIPHATEEPDDIELDAPIDEGDHHTEQDHVTTATQQAGEFDVEAYQKESLERHRKAASKNKQPLVISHSVPKTQTGEAGEATQTKENGDKGKAENKPRQKPLRLDEGLLLGQKGFPKLMNDTKDFRIKGKGHEATNLSRLLQVYQFWTHQLYPKTQFKDTVQRIEKLCHSRRMLSALSVWRDEAHGKLKADMSLSESEEEDNGDTVTVVDKQNKPSVEYTASLVTDDIPSLSRAQSYPPTSDLGSEPDFTADDIADTEMDALINEYSNKPNDDNMWEDEDYFTAMAPANIVEAGLNDGDQSMRDDSHVEIGIKSQHTVEEDYWGEDMYI
ncbi:hypothetical protein AMATHDRAFT_44829 [Amanita thiersii Skay4041]|uniref:Chromosome segregation in meiosis protein n=1 Tax=Amanita thiersii Skay4041 TaxID=703135 RepID=A0A2A9NW03_9AGAR|nr:hypothetical protein AMATHDRAFT_44829 [Amanita thiersii Skay4041]